MQVKSAVVARVDQLCGERGISLHQLAGRCNMTASTLYSMIPESRKDIGIVTIQRICDGFGISLVQFFDCELFEKEKQLSI